MAQTQVKNQKQASTSAKKMNFQPLGNRVLLRRLEQEEKLKGGIILPDTARKKQEQAMVVAIGPGKKDETGKLIPPSVKEGDIVLIEKYSGQEVAINEEDFVIAKADDLIAIIEK